MEVATVLRSMNSVQLERYGSLIARQEGRLRMIVALTFFSVLEWSIILISYYCIIPMWLLILCSICILCNGVLIFWLFTLYIESKKREKQIKKQAFDAYKNR